LEFGIDGWELGTGEWELATGEWEVGTEGGQLFGGWGGRGGKRLVRTSGRRELTQS